MRCSTWNACHRQVGAHLHADGKTFTADLYSHHQLHAGVEAGNAAEEASA